MDCLFVLDVHRAQGLGVALLASAKQIAIDRGYAEMQWQTPSWNRDACRFYLREGAAAVDKQRFWVFLPAVCP